MEKSSHKNGEIVPVETYVARGQGPSRARRQTLRQSSQKNIVPIGTYAARGLGLSRASCQRFTINHLNKNGEVPVRTYTT